MRLGSLRALPTPPTGWFWNSKGKLEPYPWDYKNGPAPAGAKSVLMSDGTYHVAPSGTPPLGFHYVDKGGNFYYWGLEPNPETLLATDNASSRLDYSAIAAAAAVQSQQAAQQAASSAQGGNNKTLVLIVLGLIALMLMSSGRKRKGKRKGRR